jgi:6-hydroxycyclohex-1-ene-1-carbonyl-CoA dehydrogenase
VPMRALQLTAVGAPLELRELPEPTPGDDEVLVRVAGCGVCHTDIGFWQDGVPTKHPLPLTLGHEVAGTVVDAGPSYAALVDREVIVPAVMPCGTCDLCSSGRGNICRRQRMPGNDIQGGFADYIVVPGRGLCPVETRGSYELADLSVIADAVTTPYQAIVRSGLAADQLAIVIGVGGIGIYCAQIAAGVGAHVVAIDVDDAKLAKAAAHGAGHTINATTPFKDLRAQVRDFARARGCADHGWKIYECSGTGPGQETAFGLLTYAATLMVIGFTLAKVELRLSNAMAFDATIQGTWGCKPELYPEALALVTGGTVKLSPFIRTFPLAEGPEVARRVAAHEIAERAILVP